MAIERHFVFSVIAIVLASKVYCTAATIFPADRTKVSNWFRANVLPFSKRIGTLDGALENAERNRRVIKVRKDGSGHFKTVTEAIASIPEGNQHRVIVNIGPGIYNEKIVIPDNKPFVTLRGNRKSMPVLRYNGTAKKYGTFDCATLTVLSNYFTAIYVTIENSSPKPSESQAMEGAQAVALRLNGDKAALYGCKIFGYQDTLLDESGHHFFMSCLIQGTVDFIFGSARSIYLETRIKVVEEKWRTVIVAQAKQKKNEDSGFSFVHCTIFGKGKPNTFLGRGWMDYSDVVYSYSTMDNTILPQGWDNSGLPEKNMLFGEFQNNGPGSNYLKRVPYSTRLSPSAVQPYLSLSYIHASTWLLPPYY